MAGGRANVEEGLQTGLDIVATLAWWDWQTSETLQSEEELNLQSSYGLISIIASLFLLSLLAVVFFLVYARKKAKPNFATKD
jgi:hypothetical protein